eukprot:scaffold26301_cov52-Attheya_sp.AAC.9
MVVIIHGFPPVRAILLWVMTGACIVLGKEQGRMSCFVPGAGSSYRDTSVLMMKRKAVSQEPDRRSVLQTFVGTSAAWMLIIGQRTPPSLAETGDEKRVSETLKKPYASLDALLPAARVKKLIDTAVQLASDLVVSEDKSLSEDNKERKKDLAVAELERLLLQPQNFTRSSSSENNVLAVPKQPAKQYLEAYKQTRENMNWLEQPGAWLVQNGEIDTWKRLKRQERARESTDEIRAALNVYTSSLAFNANEYALTASPKAERSRLIREDRIPDVKTVIASDMGMRYLYRNQILSSMDDCRAELRYQLQQTNNFDGEELLHLLKEAQTASDNFFHLIDDRDVRDAFETISTENVNS